MNDAICRISIDPPDSVQFEGEERPVRVGPTVYRALRLMLARECCEASTLKAAVWGTRAGDHPETSLRALLGRVNGLLRAHGCRRVLSLDVFRVTWVDDTQT